MVKERMGRLIDMVSCRRVIHRIEMDSCYIMGHQIDNLIPRLG